MRRVERRKEKGTNLLSVDIDARQPAPETRMRVIPSNDHLRPRKQRREVRGKPAAANETQGGRRQG